MLSRKAMMGAQGGGVSLPLNIDFNTLEDGPLPAPLTGTTWTVSGGRAVNTPTAGENVLTGGDMEDDPVTYWPATGTPATREKSDAQAHGGTYSLHLVTDGVNEGVSKNIAATPGRFYRFSSFLRRASGGQPRVRLTGNGLDAGSNYVSSADTWELREASGMAGGTGVSLIVQSSGTAADWFVDDAELVELAFGSVVAPVSTSESSVTAEITISTLAPGTWAGWITNIDDLDNPQNFLVAALTYDSGTYRAQLWKVQDGTPARIITGNVTLGTAKKLKLVKNGTTCQLFYGGTQVGEDQIIAGLTSTLHGPFATSEESAIGFVSLQATPFDEDTTAEPELLTTVAWISDPHTGAGVPYAAGTFANFCAAVESYSPDALICTGDIAERCYQDDYDRYLAGVAAITCPQYVIPGDHDEGPLWPDDGPGPFDYAMWDANIGEYRFVVDFGPFRFLGFTARREGIEYNWYVPAADVAWLTAQLTDLEGQIPVLLTHEGPPDCDTGEGEEDMVTLCAANGVKLWLRGHGHNDMTVYQTGTLRVVTGPSCAGGGTPLVADGGWGRIFVYGNRLEIAYMKAAAPFDEITDPAIYPKRVVYKLWG